MAVAKIILRGARLDAFEQEQHKTFGLSISIVVTWRTSKRTVDEKKSHDYQARASAWVDRRSTKV